MDIEASDKEYAITVEVPGVDGDDITLEIADNLLTIKGEKKQESEKKDKDICRIERSYGSFQRVLLLPEDADQENINAKFKNGILTITVLRKAMPRQKRKMIDIKKSE